MISTREKIVACKGTHPEWGYKNIADHVGVSKDVVTYYLSSTRQQRIKATTRRRRLHLPLERKVENFIAKKKLREKTDGFQRRTEGKTAQRKIAFTYHDVMAKLGQNPKCYLTGSPIDWTKPKTFVFDHILPSSRGGTNALDNLDLLRADVNKMKADLTPEEFIGVCKEVVIHAGYEILAPWQNSNAPVSKTECG